MYILYTERIKKFSRIITNNNNNENQCKQTTAHTAKNMHTHTQVKQTSLESNQNCVRIWSIFCIRCGERDFNVNFSLYSIV